VGVASPAYFNNRIWNCGMQEFSCTFFGILLHADYFLLRK
jgi:hypothetical protein